MAIMISLSRFRNDDPPPMASVNVRVCRFERALIRGGLAEGGILTCLESGRERQLRVAMTWDVLAELRAELSRHGVVECDETIVRHVLRYWGVEEFKRRLSEGAVLPEEGLLLNCVGDPCSAQPRRLFQASGLLPPEAA